MGDAVLREREQGQQIPPWRERLCVYVCVDVSVCTPLIFSVFFLLLKQELLSILKTTLALTLRPAPAPGISHSGYSRAVLSLADIQDKDTPLRKVRRLLKIRQNLRGFISFIFRPTSINSHSKTISAAVREGNSDGSKLPLYIQERERHNID